MRTSRLSSGSIEPRIAQEAPALARARGVEPGVTIGEPPLSEPAAPSPVSGVRAPHGTTMSALAGFAKPVVAAALLATVIGTAAPALGAPLEGVVVSPPAVAEEVAPPDATRAELPIGEARIRADLTAFNNAMAQLESRHREGRLSAEELAGARRVLYAALIEHRIGATVPRDVRGRIDLDALVLSSSGVTYASTTRGGQVVERLLAEIERRMRVTARDMAYPENVRFIEGAPGYKELPEAELRRMVGDALQDIPIGELPGGDRAAELIRRLPYAGGIRAEELSYRELERALGDAGKQWLETNLRPLIEGHELEVGVVAFAAVTGLRAASPEAAGLMDRLRPRVTIYRDTFADDRIETRARLAYRDRHVFPDLDLTANANLMVGPRTTVRAGLGGTVSFEADERFTATATVGAHHTAGNLWLDAQSTYYTENNHVRASLSAGHYDPDLRLSTSTNLSGIFGPHAAASGANGRVAWEVDVAKELKLHGAEGTFGAFVGVGADTNGENRDTRAGLVLRLRF